MEQKQYSVDDFEFRIHSLQVVDADGNPIDTSEPVAYKLVDEDGSVLKEGTLEGDNIISLDGVETRKFKVEFETLDVTDTEGFEHIDEDEDKEETGEEDEASQEGTSGDGDQADQADDGSGPEQSSQESVSDDDSADDTGSKGD